MNSNFFFSVFGLAFFSALLLMPDYDFESINQGFYKGQMTAEGFETKLENFEPVFFKEGLYGSVLVQENDCDGLGCDKSIIEINNNPYLLFYGPTFSGNYTTMSVNGAVQCSNGRADLTTLTLLGGLPVILHDDPKTALNIGLGCGKTLEVLQVFPLDSIDNIEIDQAVIDASSYFEFGNPLDDPRSTLYVTDARNFLLTTNKKYDVIVNEPPIPLSTSVSNLYSKEFMELMKEHLNDNGVVAQYLTISLFNSNENDLEPFKIYYKTFQSVFPYVKGYVAFVQVPDKIGIDSEDNLFVSEYALNISEMVLVGSLKPIDLSFQEVDERLDQRLKDSFAEVGIDSLQGYLLFDEKDLEGLVDESVPFNTDDLPLIEFAVARNSKFLENTGTVDLLINYIEEK